MNLEIEKLFTLRGKKVIVTGGHGHLGSAITAALYQLDALVVPTTSEEIIDDDSILEFAHLDLLNKESIFKFVDSFIKKHGNIDVLVNNAWIWPDKESLNFGTREMSSGFPNVAGTLLLTELVYQNMLTSKIPGSIINVSSMYGQVSPNMKIYRETPGMGNAIEYGMEKAAIKQMTRYIASVGGKHNIRCNTVSPGPFSKPGSFDGKEWFRDELTTMMPLGRIGQPEELKGVIALLASRAGSYITGADIPVDGGWTCW